MSAVKYNLMLSIVILLVACNKDVDFNTLTSENLLVVDGLIEQGEHPYVILTEVSPFFAEYNSIELRKLVIFSAKVTVSNGDTTEILSLVKNDEFFPPYVYRGFGFKGEIGKTYELNVYWNNELYEAQTTLLATVNIDSFQVEPFYEVVDTLGIIRAKFTDPPNQANYYRTFTKILGKQDGFYPFLYSVLGDNLFDGENFTFNIFRGNEGLNSGKNSVYFDLRDTVVVKFCSIDESGFRFWVTAEKEMALSGNPIAISNKKIESNISNGALGYWTGYSFTLDTVVIEF